MALVSMPEYPDYDNVKRRAKLVNKTYTYEELCEKRLRVGEKNLEFEQYWAYKRNQGWSGMEKEEKGYFELLSNVELYLHCRRVYKQCICFTCSHCPVDSCWTRLSGKHNECISDMNDIDKQRVVINHSKRGDFDFVLQCPRYHRRNDKDIYYDYIESPVWREIRNGLIEQHPYCEGCGLGSDEIGLVVHHKNYEHLCFEDEYDDCAVLCAPCHIALHKDPEQYWDDHSIIIPAHKKSEEIWS